MRLGYFLLLVILYGVYVVGRERRYLEAGVFSSSGGLYGLYAVGREHRYLEATVFSSFGDLVWRVCSRA